jgi:hypothetical protein
MRSEVFLAHLADPGGAVAGAQLVAGQKLLIGVQSRSRPRVHSTSDCEGHAEPGQGAIRHQSEK